MNGRHVVRRFGWDCHGLPVEYEIDQKLNIKSKEDVMAYGLANYNEECRSIVMRYSKEWEQQITRVGRWIDFKNDYKTLDPTFMESVWWVFSQLHEKGLVYQGFKVMPFSTRCGTPLSNFEAGLNYKDVSDPAVIVSFPVEGDPHGAALVAWTTTPWTLPSNVALCVHPAFDYLTVRLKASNKIYIVAKARVGELPGSKKDKKHPDGGYEVLAEHKGAELVGKRYEPLLPYFSHLRQQENCQAFTVVSDEYVTDDSGTGIVHQAPAFGEDDYRVCLKFGVIARGGKVPCPVDDAGCYTDEVPDFKGTHVKEADKAIIAKLKASGRLVANNVCHHSYPFCWRSDTPLIYKAVPSWFVGVEQIKEQLLKCNEQTRWVPGYVQEKRFHNWLENARDWAVSRNRYWGTPIPIWASEDGSEIRVIGSIAELERLTGKKVTDIHRHFIDDLEIPSRTPGNPPLRRVEEVFDCWFESGSMPYAQQHYPFENKALFEDNFPADFIAEGLDQTRGWFYTLMVLSTALFGKPAFKNLICNGLVLAADGKKMSKRLKNYPPPTEIVDAHGADALRVYLINSPVVRAEPMRFKQEGVFAVVKDVFLPWYNAYRFMAQSAERLGADFRPDASLAASSGNPLDRWILSSLDSLVDFVRAEMEAYRLYTVVPRLLTFIEGLTNVYVRFNRRRLKGTGEGGEAEARTSVSVLFQVMLALTKIMSPFTPFFVENMYLNLSKLLPEGERLASVHFCDFPTTSGRPTDPRIESSVARMMQVITQGRLLREQHKLPVKSRPLRRMVVVHPDQGFLDDVTGVLGGYVKEELAVRDIEGCADALQYCTLSAVPDFKALGKRVGKAMRAVKEGILKLTQEQILQVEAGGTVDVEGFALGVADLQVKREFKSGAGGGAGMDAMGDGDVLVVLSLEQDESLAREGMAREVTNRAQQLRKRSGLQPSDAVDVFYVAKGEAAATLDAVVAAHADSMRSALAAPVLPGWAMPRAAVAVARAQVSVADGAVPFEVVLARPGVVCDGAALLEAAGGDEKRAAGLRAYLEGLGLERLKAEAQAGALEFSCEGQAVRVSSGEHFFLGAESAHAAGLKAR